MTGLFTSDPGEVSLLSALHLMSTNGGFDKLVAVTGGLQQDMLEGGAQSVAEAMTAELADAVVLGSPVRSVLQDDNGCTVSGDRVTVRARRGVVAVPPAVVQRIRFEPDVPPERSLLWQRMPTGYVLKYALLYDDAFWRDDGLTGESNAPRALFPLTLDASPRDLSRGILGCYSFGPTAAKLAKVPDEERRRLLLDDLTARFGPKIATPVHVVWRDWAADEWAHGGYMTHYAPTVLTHFGPAIREPVGRVHWAGTDTAPQSAGTIEGAVRSGQRAADEVLASS